MISLGVLPEIEKAEIAFSPMCPLLYQTLVVKR